MDIGCYLIYVSRLAFATEPTRVCGLVEFDSDTGTDVLSSAMLDFPAGQSVFTCSTQVVPYQRADPGDRTKNRSRNTLQRSA